MTGFELREMPLGIKSNRVQIEKFLLKNGLRMDQMDYYVGVFDENDELQAGGGAIGNIIKCIAVNSDVREYRLTNPLVSKLREHIRQKGYDNIFVFTKAENLEIFRSLSFFTVGKTDNTLMMESNPFAIRSYLDYISSFKLQGGTNGCIVMNCNPFTLGHRYLIECCRKQVDRLHIILVKEGESFFNYQDRIELVRRGTQDFDNVDVIEGSSYVISQATFPNYFIKNLDDVSVEQVKLDLNIFINHIAKALDISVRFMGSEPTDRLTALYNEYMHKLLPENNIRAVEIERIKSENKVVSASRVRELIKNNDYEQLKLLLPQTTLDFILSSQADYIRQK